MFDLSQYTDPPSNQPVSRNPGFRNEKRILALLQQNRQMTQTRLCHLTGLNSSTVSYTVARLREKGLILEEPGKSRSRGAKPVLININPAGQNLIGVEINPSHLFVGLFDFTTHMIDAVRSAISPFDQHPPQQIADLIEITIRGLMGRHKCDPSKLIGIGLTLSGSISPEGVVHLSSPLGWKNIPIRDMIQKRFPDIPVSAHSTRVRLLAEMNLAEQDAFKNVLHINIANGVGASILVDGKLPRGATARTGEIGHIVIDPAGPVCGCGNRGCLEALVSGPSIVRQLRGDLAAWPESSLHRDITDNDTPERIVELWGQAIRKNDPCALARCQTVCRQIAAAAAIAINCFDPDTIMLAGYVSREILPQLTAAIQTAIAGQVFDAATRTLKIIPARSGEEALIRGVATAIMHDYLDGE